MIGSDRGLWRNLELGGGMRLGEFSFMNSRRMEPEHAEFTRECLWIPGRGRAFFFFLLSVIGLTSDKSFE
jgi:hypothetical protein